MFTESFLHRMGQGYPNSNSFNPPHKHYSCELHVTPSETILGGQGAEGLVHSSENSAYAGGVALLYFGRAVAEDRGLHLYELEVDLCNGRIILTRFMNILLHLFSLVYVTEEGNLHWKMGGCLVDALMEHLSTEVPPWLTFLFTMYFTLGEC